MWRHWQCVSAPPSPARGPRYASLCDVQLSCVARALGGLDQAPHTPPSRTFINLAGPFTNKRKEYSERRIIG